MILFKFQNHQLVTTDQFIESTTDNPNSVFDIPHLGIKILLGEIDKEIMGVCIHSWEKYLLGRTSDFHSPAPSSNNESTVRTGYMQVYKK